MFAGSNEFDRDPSDVFDGQRRATASVAVQFGHDAAVKFQGVVEALGAVDRILARHAIDDKEHLVGLDLTIDRRQFGH